MRNNLFDVFLNSVCKCYIEKFCIYVHQRSWPVIFLYQGNSGFFKGSVWTIEEGVQRALLDKQKLWGCQGWREIQDNETSCLGVIFQPFCSRLTSLILTSSVFQQFSAPLLRSFLWVGTSQGTVCSGVVTATPPCWHGQQLVEALLRVVCTSHGFGPHGWWSQGQLLGSR